LLHKALRNVLGTHVEQAGSLVGPDSFRFDFTHFAALTDEELSEVERQVNEKILAGMNVNISEMPVDEARKLGAMALFGEKYGETVRVVRMGDFSIELCGGTHLDNTAKAGLFKIISEASIAAGVRRIEAVCGFEILNKIERDIKLIMEAAEAVKTSPKDLLPKINSALSEIKALKQENAKLKEHEAKSRAAGLLGSAADIGGIKVVTSGYRDTEPDTLRAMGEELCRIEQNAVVVFSAENDGKLVFTANCGKNAISRGIKAGDLVREVSKIAGGGGGGRPDSAMAGGKDISKAGAALGFVYEYVKNITG
jgi:alanyl-tRNA synthetase